MIRNALLNLLSTQLAFDCSNYLPIASYSNHINEKKNLFGTLSKSVNTKWVILKRHF